MLVHELAAYMTTRYMNDLEQSLVLNNTAETIVYV